MWEKPWYKERILYSLRIFLGKSYLDHQGWHYNFALKWYNTPMKTAPIILVVIFVVAIGLAVFSGYQKTHPKVDETATPTFTTEPQFSDYPSSSEK